MKRIFAAALLAFLLASQPAFAGWIQNPFTKKQDFTPAIEEADGSPSINALKKLVVGNGSLTDDGGGQATLSTSGGAGDVVGPASSTDNAVARFDSTTGKLLQNGVLLVGDTGNITGAGTLNTHTIPGGTGTLALTSGNVATATALAANGTNCSAGSFPLGVDASGSSESCTVAVGTSTTDTLSNKRITPRVGTVADAATITPTADDSDIYTVTALAQAATIAAPSGTPVNGQKLIIRLLDNGTGRALTWNAIYQVIGTTLPTTTVASKYSYVGSIYNTASSKWDVVAVTTQA